MHASGGQGPEDERDVVQVPARLGDGVRRVREGNHLLQGEGSATASGLSQLHTDAPSPAQVAKDLQRAIDASGRFRSGTADGSTKHDDHLTEAYRE